MERLLKSSAVALFAIVSIAGFTAIVEHAAGQSSQATATNPDLPPLPIEDVNIVESLPDKYPESWFIVHDAAFTHMLSGEGIVFDAAEENHARQWNK